MYYVLHIIYSLQWRHNRLDGVSNYQPYDCLLNCLFRRRQNKTPKLRVTGLCEGNSPATGELPAQRDSNAENVPIYDVIMLVFFPHWHSVSSTVASWRLLLPATLLSLIAKQGVHNVPFTASLWGNTVVRFYGMTWPCTSLLISQFYLNMRNQFSKTRCSVNVIIDAHRVNSILISPETLNEIKRLKCWRSNS